ncbi:MAG: hypothetical protein ACM3U2_16715, partial [Deltaproteobacteria bacterium]
MKTSAEIEQGLVQLGNELGTRPDLAARVLDDFRSRPASCVQPGNAGRIRFSRQGLVAATAAGLLVGLTAWWLAEPSTLYARVAAALERAKTVHVTGWTRNVIRKWPLESPPKETVDAEVRYPI